MNFSHVSWGKFRKTPDTPPNSEHIRAIIVNNYLSILYHNLMLSSFSSRILEVLYFFQFSFLPAKVQIMETKDLLCAKPGYISDWGRMLMLH